jgi:hypothetical protein
MPTFSNGVSNSAGLFSGTNYRYTTPQPGTLEVDSQCPSLSVMDVGNWEDVLNYLGINPEV